MRGYLVGALKCERSSGSRGGGSRWCKHDLGMEDQAVTVMSDLNAMTVMGILNTLVTICSFMEDQAEVWLQVNKCSNNFSHIAVLWHCWLCDRMSFRLVKDWVMRCLCGWSVVQMICILSSWCHRHPSSLASVKYRIVTTFWYRLTQVVLEKWPLNGCSVVVQGGGQIFCEEII